MPIVVLKGGPLDAQQFNYHTDAEVPDSIYCYDESQFKRRKLRYQIEFHSNGVYYGFLNKEQYYANHRANC